MILQEKQKHVYKIQFDSFCDAMFLKARIALKVAPLGSRKKLRVLA